MIQNDIVVFGLIAATLGAVFWTASREQGLWKRFYTFVPALLLCYLIPGIYNTGGLIDGQNTKLYNPIARDILLPAALILLTLAVDIKGILRLGPKLVLMYLGASASIMLGAVVAFLAMRALHPETVAGDTWAGMAALAGSWIGGGANMLAMREVFDVNATTFGQFAVVDVGVGYVWMAALIFLAGRAAKIDARSGADTSAIDELKERIARFQAEHERIPSLTDLMLIVAVAFGGVGLSHAIGAPLAAWFKANVSWASQFSLDAPFVWVVVLSTTLGLSLSFTRARTLEGAGASRLGSLLLYFLIACIGMQMDLLALLDRPWLFLLGLIWIAVHIVLLWCLGKLLKVPFFYFAIGSQSNIGGPASAPVVAAAFHPALAPVGVLLGTMGYATGTTDALRHRQPAFDQPRLRVFGVLLKPRLCRPQPIRVPPGIHVGHQPRTADTRQTPGQHDLQVAGGIFLGHRIGGVGVHLRAPLRRQYDQVAGFMQHRMHRGVIAHIDIAGDDARLGLAPVAAGNRFACGHVVQAKAMRGEQALRVGEGDVAHAGDVHGGCRIGHAGHAAPPMQARAGRGIRVCPGLQAAPRRCPAHRAGHPSPGRPSPHRRRCSRTS